ncbi:hypothetical protein [Weissella confusa]|uniref:hypothetical protein n=1 Tax=Weissella confusa TaxID=1583 RepID=UPI0018F1B8C0|nr:hypothetical protein [Weissella confusa]MBJ7686559.1 hypothetical protein [Weissella confusa]MBJ7696717.1 hypothetical protein [Weissella confusa]
MKRPNKAFRIISGIIIIVAVGVLHHVDVNGDLENYFLSREYDAREASFKAANDSLYDSESKQSEKENLAAEKRAISESKAERSSYLKTKSSLAKASSSNKMNSDTNESDVSSSETSDSDMPESLTAQQVQAALLLAAGTYSSNNDSDVQKMADWKSLFSEAEDGLDVVTTDAGIGFETDEDMSNDVQANVSYKVDSNGTIQLNRLNSDGNYEPTLKTNMDKIKGLVRDYPNQIATIAGHLQDETSDPE